MLWGINSHNRGDQDNCYRYTRSVLDHSMLVRIRTYTRCTRVCVCVCVCVCVYMCGVRESEDGGKYVVKHDV